MHEMLQKICDSLESASKLILTSAPHSDTLMENSGWQFLPLTKFDFSNMFTDLSLQIKDLNIDTLSSEVENRLHEIPRKIDLLKINVIPNLYNGHGKASAPILINTLDWVRLELSPIFSWEILHDKNALPKKLSAKLTSINSQLDNILPDKEELLKSIELFKNASETIENLPTDIEELKEAKKAVEKHKTDSSVSYEKIQNLLKESQIARDGAIDNAISTEKLVESCEDAYRITTTKGLAGAFELRAISLNNSMAWWVFFLTLALGAGGYLGYLRFEAFGEIIKEKNSTTTVIVMEFILSILGLGAPIWFAWIATKQISQRFKLSEDYSYKASVAKAYEGYKKEATRLDVNLEHRLFSSALSRLEEAPLRLVDDETHGSPWQELLESQQFKNALNTFPDMREKLLDLAKEGISRVGNKNGKTTVDTDSESK